MLLLFSVRAAEDQRERAVFFQFAVLVFCERLLIISLLVWWNVEFDSIAFLFTLHI